MPCVCMHTHHKHTLDTHTHTLSRVHFLTSLPQILWFGNVFLLLLSSPLPPPTVAAWEVSGLAVCTPKWPLGFHQHFKQDIPWAFLQMMPQLLQRLVRNLSEAHATVSGPRLPGYGGWLCLSQVHPAPSCSSTWAQPECDPLGHNMVSNPSHIHMHQKEMKAETRQMSTVSQRWTSTATSLDGPWLVFSPGQWGLCNPLALLPPKAMLSTM